MQRVCVIGVTGSGKTTLANRIAAQLRLDYVEMDSLYWNPHWTPVDPEIFRSRIASVAAGDAWVTDGNYSRARDILWPRADTFVWLDLPFHVTFMRLVHRTFRRWLQKAELWNGNRESLREHFFSRDSIFLWPSTLTRVTVGSFRRCSRSSGRLERRSTGCAPHRLWSTGRALPADKAERGSQSRLVKGVVISALRQV